MLSVAVKNTILVILIILIIHFLIKALSPKKDDHVPIKDTVIKESFDEVVTTNTISSSTPTPESILKPISDIPTPPNSCQPLLQTKESNDKIIKSDCVLDQPNPNAFLLLNTYEDENPMNNNRWMDVDLYDEFSSHIAAYDNQCKPI